MWISLWILIPLGVSLLSILLAAAFRLIQDTRIARERANRLEFIVSNIPDLVIRIDEAGNISYMNPASLVYFGKSANTLAGKNLLQLFRDLGILLTDEQAIKRVMETGRAEIIESVMDQPDHPKRNLEIRILSEPRIRRRGKKVLVLIRDITRRKETELSILQAKQKAEENDRKKSAFLASMSHEIRTPLNAIVGFSQIIQEEDLSAEEKTRYFEYINQNNNQLISLVNDIIDISKLESNQLIIREDSLNLNKMMDQVREIIENEKKVRSKDHLLIIPEKELPDDQSWVITDTLRLRQILLNLLVNSVKFTPKGFIRFGYNVLEDKQLLFYVRDTGIGIPKEKQEEVFQYFRQLDDGPGRSNTGTGLGLAISRNLVALLGGKIWLESEEGKGTTFFFTLPYRVDNF